MGFRRTGRQTGNKNGLKPAFWSYWPDKTCRGSMADWRSRANSGAGHSLDDPHFVPISLHDCKNRYIV